MMLYIKYESSGPCTFLQFNAFKYLFIDPVTYLCNQSEPFEQCWYGTTQGSFLFSLVKFPLAVQEK